jgi:hypothetical protein
LRVKDERGYPPHDDSCSPIRVVDFDHIAANMRQCSIFHGKRQKPADIRGHQLRLNPAVRLLLVVPCGVSPIAPATLTPSNNFCSAPILRSHLSSVDESVWPGDHDPARMQVG